MIAVNGVNVSFGATTLLKDVSFILNKGEKVALTGRNGAGKSTLLKIIAGLQTPTGGNVSRQNDITVGYLPQQMPVSDTTTLIEETRKAFSETAEINRQLDESLARLESLPEDDEATRNKLLDRIEVLMHRASINSAADMEAELEQTLLGLGFVKEDFQRPTSEFSGGWRMRVELAKVLLRKPDVLLLDEPTNHLDIESIRWLETFLNNRNKTLVIVSHDKAFLDNLTTRTIELVCGKSYDYKVAYSQYLVLREETLEQQRRAYANQQKEIADIKDFIERFRYKATKAVQVQSRIKQLEKIVPIEIDETDTKKLALRFPPAKRSGDFPLIVEGLAKSYGDHNVFHDVEFTMRRGEKVAFVGKNGEGKSTLVKCILGEIPYTGTLKIGHNIEIGYFAQNAAQQLDETITVFDTVDNVATGDIRTRLKDLLGAFLFRGEEVDKKVSVLSGGEKTRLAMLKLLLQPANFLILDEPTNHLDITTKEILKEALRKFDGTLILVSHDRDFLDGLVDKVYEFGGGRVKEHLGGIYDFLQAKDLQDLRAVETAVTPSKSQTSPAATASAPQTTSKDDYLAKKEAEKAKKRVEKAIARIEDEITAHELKLSSLEERMAVGDSSSDILKDYEDTRNLLSDAMNRWEELQSQL